MLTNVMFAYFWQVADAAEHREDALDHLSAAQLQVMHARKITRPI